MLVGLPTETKPAEARVGLTPAAVETLAHDSHRVLVQAGAGLGSGFPDALYQRAGATIVPTAAEAWSADLVVKVKEPHARWRRRGWSASATRRCRPETASCRCWPR
jgi:alanine dehydrogenase